MRLKKFICLFSLTQVLQNIYSHLIIFGMIGKFVSDEEIYYNKMRKLDMKLRKLWKIEEIEKLVNVKRLFCIKIISVLNIF